MKKILLLFNCLLLAGFVYCQKLDTVYVRNLSLKGECWDWIDGGWSPSDSATKKWYKKYKAVINPIDPSNSTQVVIDSVPGAIALNFYSMFKNAPTYVQEKLGNEIRQKIAAYPPLTPFTAIVDAFGDAAVINQKKNGREDREN